LTEGAVLLRLQLWPGKKATEERKMTLEKRQTKTDLKSD